MTDNHPDFIEIQKYLKGVDYPTDRDGLVAAAKENGAPDDLVTEIGGLPDKQYSAPTEVTKDITP